MVRHVLRQRLSSWTRLELVSRVHQACVFCMGYVLTRLLYVTELNNLLHCAIDDCFVNDRLAMVLEIAGTGRDDGLP